MASAESVREIIEPHLARSEEPRAVFTDDEEMATVVTDRRIIRSRDHELDGQNVTDVESVMLTGPQILGARIEAREATAPSWGRASLGTLFTGIGLLLCYAGIAESIWQMSIAQTVGIIVVLGGLVLIPSGAYIVYDAFRTESSHVRIDVISTGGETTLKFPVEATEIANAVSTVVGGN